MAHDLVTVPCLDDNYAFILHDRKTGATFVFDVPEAEPIAAALDARGWRADEIWLTHHHGDHVAGVGELRSAYGSRVTGAAADAHRLPPLDAAVSAGEAVDTPFGPAQVIDVSGHTLGHVAYHFPDHGVAFTGDSLMALGCGRVFEGTMPMMWESLSRLAALPPDTLICSGHEYTAANARFALTMEPGNAALRARADDIETARAKGQATVPSKLSLELATNPFLRAHSEEIRATVGLKDAPDAEVFAAVRGAKDRF